MVGILSYYRYRALMSNSFNEVDSIDLSVGFSLVAILSFK